MAILFLYSLLQYHREMYMRQIEDSKSSQVKMSLFTQPFQVKRVKIGK